MPLTDDPEACVAPDGEGGEGGDGNGSAATPSLEHGAAQLPSSWPAADLDVIGAIAGTDKSSSVSWSWDYLRAYQPALEPFRDQPVNLIEVGIANGESLYVWERFFTSAVIVGVDINPGCLRFARDRVKVRIGSQDDPAFLHALCVDHPPTIFIDDGSHQAHHIVYTLERVFPALAAGGLYIIEDLAFHFEPHAAQWRGNGAVSVPDYLAGLARNCMARGRDGVERWGDLGYLAGQVASISFLQGSAIIRKKAARNLAQDLECARAELSAVAVTPQRLVNFARFLLRHGGPLEEAEAAARQAVELGGEQPDHVLVLGDILARRNRRPAALESVRSALQVHSGSHELWWRLGALQGELGFHDEAVKSLERAAAARPGDPSILRALSVAAERSGNPKRALEAMEAALQRAPGWRSDGEIAARLAVLKQAQ